MKTDILKTSEFIEDFLSMVQVIKKYAVASPTCTYQYNQGYRYATDTLSRSCNIGATKEHLIELSVGNDDFDCGVLAAIRDYEPK